MLKPFDTSKPLHIIFNVDDQKNTDTTGGKIESFSELISKFEGVQYLIIEYNIEKYLMLLSLFPDDLEIFTWIHPNIKLSMVDSGHTFPSVIVADTLKKKHPYIKFNMISRHQGSAPKEITDKYIVHPITILNMLQENNILPQLIRSLKESSLEFHKKEGFDFAIITALYDDEFEAVVKTFDLKKHESFKLGNKNIYTGSVTGIPERKILAVYQTEAGRTDASSLVTEVIKEYNPRYIFMTGVCGGDKDIPLGSIVVAKFIFTFDKGKLNESGFFRELEFVKIDEDSIRLIREGNNATLKKVKATLISEDGFKEFEEFQFQTLKAIIDPVACSSFVVDKENYFEEVIKSIDRKATAVEMESYGIARGAETVNSGRTKSIIIKSVMDNTSGKNDKAKKFASYTSALYLKHLLQNGIIC